MENSTFGRYYQRASTKRPSCDLWYRLPKELKDLVLSFLVVFPYDLIVTARFWTGATARFSRRRYEQTAMVFDIQVKVPKFLTPDTDHWDDDDIVTDRLIVPDGIKGILDLRLVSKQFYDCVTRLFYAENTFEVFDTIWLHRTPADFDGNVCVVGRFPMAHRFLAYIAQAVARNGFKRYHDRKNPPLSYVKSLKLDKLNSSQLHLEPNFRLAIRLVCWYCELTKLSIHEFRNGVTPAMTSGGQVTGVSAPLGPEFRELVWYLTKRSKDRFELYIPANRALQERIKAEAKIKTMASDYKSDMWKAMVLRPRLSTVPFISSQDLRSVRGWVRPELADCSSDRLAKLQRDVNQYEALVDGKDSKSMQAALQKELRLMNNPTMEEKLEAYVKVQYSMPWSDCSWWDNTIYPDFV
jgi:hypothetical protein